MMRGQIFKIAMAVVFLFLLWLQSLFAETEHVIRGDVYVFKYNWVPWIFLVLMCLAFVGFAEIARRFMKDRVLAIICLLGIPLFDLISLQYICERVEISKDLLVHRREWPHTRFNVDIPWNSIQSATKIEREKAGLFAPNFYQVGYEFILANGQLQELPSNTVLTSAQIEIDRILAVRQIPVNKRIVPIQK